MGDYPTKVRPATADDVPAVATLFDLYRQFYRQEPDLPRAAAFLMARIRAGESRVFVAETGPSAVGFAQCYPTFTSVGLAPAWVLNDLFVHPDGRGRGAGAMLLDAAASAAEAAGAAFITLETEKANATAQRLYERNGYIEPVGVLRYAMTLPRVR